MKPAKVEEVARRLAELGCEEVSIGDTIGVAVPTQVFEVMGRLADGSLRAICHTVDYAGVDAVGQ